MTTVSPSDVSVETFDIGRRTAVLSLDLEADFGGDEFEGVERFPDLLAVLKEEDVPLTVFVEGRVFQKYPDMLRQAYKDGVDVQLHCLDHRHPGDTPQTLREAGKIYRNVTGAKPQGYRAHTFRLRKDLYETLLNEGFKWDSSILPAQFGYGANRNWSPETSGSTYFRLDKKLYEFPVAVHPRLKIPFIHSYQTLLRKYPARLLRYTGGMPELLIYDMHMADLVRTRAINTSRAIPESARLFYRMSWLMRGKDTFAELKRLIKILKKENYRFLSLQELYLEIKDKE